MERCATEITLQIKSEPDDIDNNYNEQSYKTNLCTERNNPELPGFVKDEFDIEETCLKTENDYDDGKKIIIDNGSNCNNDNENCTGHLLDSVENESNIDVSWIKSVIDCKTKWTSLRNSYSRALRQEKDVKSGSAGSNRKRWYLADAMSLKNFMKHHTSMGNNLDKDNKTALTETSDKLSEPSSPSLSSQSSTSFANTSFETPPPTKRQKSISAAEQVAGPMIKFLEARSNQVEDENLTFFKGLLPDMKKLSPRNQRNFKRDIYRRLCDLVDQQDHENMVRQPTSSTTGTGLTPVTTFSAYNYETGNT